MKLMIYFSNEQASFKLTNHFLLLLRHAVEKTLSSEKVGGKCEVSLTFTDNEGIYELNRRFRSIDRPTDVLSFPQLDRSDFTDNSFKMLGDIVISLEKAAEQAREIGHSTEHEAAFLCVHSTLHLLGYDHENGEEAEKKMFTRQKEIINSIVDELSEFDKQ